MLVSCQRKTCGHFSDLKNTTGNLGGQSLFHICMDMGLCIHMHVYICMYIYLNTHTYIITSNINNILKFAKFQASQPDMCSLQSFILRKVSRLTQLLCSVWFLWTLLCPGKKRVYNESKKRLSNSMWYRVDWICTDLCGKTY